MRWLCARIASLAAVLTLLVGCGPAGGDGGVKLVPVPIGDKYPGAVEEGALRWACAASDEKLQAFFALEKIPFQAPLLRTRAEGRCHIFYRPSIHGFAASTENDSVSELFLNIDSLAFLSQHDAKPGDSLDVLRTMLPLIDTPLTVTLGVAEQDARPYFQAAEKKYFDKSIHQFRYRKAPASNHDPWVQDFLKAGFAGSTQKILVTREAFEGNPALAPSLRPLLDSFAGERYVRSRLAFEGGDIILARSPRDPAKRLLFHGTSAKPYWGNALSLEEYAYVLRVEFGADETIYLGDITPHADYTMNLLGDQPVALLAQPVCRDMDVAHAAIGLLQATYGATYGQSIPELEHLDRLLLANNDTGEYRWDSLDKVVERARDATQGWKITADPTLRTRLEAHVRDHCPQEPAACTTGPLLTKMLDHQRDLLVDWVDAAAQVRIGQVMANRLLSVIARQVEGCDEATGERLDNLRDRLRNLGFQVIRVPWIQPDGAVSHQWPGVSYVNSALIGNTLFLPSLGINPVEREWIAALERQLPKGIQARAVPAVFSLMQNGGIHCVMAFGRTP